MTTKDHLSRAKDYISKGEGFYRKAAEEIEAARAEDFDLTWDAVAKKVGKSEKWCRVLVSWSTNGEGTATPFSEPQGTVAKRHAKSVLRDSTPREIAKLLDTPAIRRNVERAIVHAQPREPITARPAPTGPSFIDLVVRVNSALIELESMVGSWRRPKELPAEFSAASFDDIAEKAMRIKDHVNALRSADNDEFQKIVRAFRDNTDA